MSSPATATPVGTYNPADEITPYDNDNWSLLIFVVSVFWMVFLILPLLFLIEEFTHKSRRGARRVSPDDDPDEEGMEEMENDEGLKVEDIGVNSSTVVTTEDVGIGPTCVSEMKLMKKEQRDQGTGPIKDEPILVDESLGTDPEVLNKMPIIVPFQDNDSFPHTLPGIDKTTETKDKDPFPQKFPGNDKTTETEILGDTMYYHPERVVEDKAVGTSMDKINEVSAPTIARRILMKNTSSETVPEKFMNDTFDKGSSSQTQLTDSIANAKKTIDIPAEKNDSIPGNEALAMGSEIVMVITPIRTVTESNTVTKPETFEDKDDYDVVLVDDKSTSTNVNTLENTSEPAVKMRKRRLLMKNKASETDYDEEFTKDDFDLASSSQTPLAGGTTELKKQTKANIPVEENDLLHFDEDLGVPSSQTPLADVEFNNQRKSSIPAEENDLMHFDEDKGMGPETFIPTEIDPGTEIDEHSNQADDKTLKDMRKILDAIESESLFKNDSSQPLLLPETKIGDKPKMRIPVEENANRYGSRSPESGYPRRPSSLGSGRNRKSSFPEENINELGRKKDSSPDRAINQPIRNTYQRSSSADSDRRSKKKFPAQEYKNDLGQNRRPNSESLRKPRRNTQKSSLTPGSDQSSKRKENIPPKEGKGNKRRSLTAEPLVSKTNQYPRRSRNSDAKRRGILVISINPVVYCPPVHPNEFSDRRGQRTKSLDRSQKRKSRSKSTKSNDHSLTNDQVLPVLDGIRENTSDKPTTSILKKTRRTLIKNVSFDSDCEELLRSKKKYSKKRKIQADLDENKFRRNSSLNSNSYDYSQSSNSYDFSQSSNSYDYFQSTNPYDFSQSTNPSDFSQSSNSYDYSQSSNSYDYSSYSNSYSSSSDRNIHLSVLVNPVISICGHPINNYGFPRRNGARAKSSDRGEQKRNSRNNSVKSNDPCFDNSEVPLNCRKCLPFPPISALSNKSYGLLSLANFAQAEGAYHSGSSDDEFLMCQPPPPAPSSKKKRHCKE